MAKSMLDRLREEQKKMRAKASGGGNDLFLKLPKSDEAEVKVRILPAKNFYTDANPNLFYKKFGVHWINGKRILCPQYTLGDACPICETVRELQDGSEEDINAAKDFRVKKRTWVNVVEVDKDGNYGKPKIFEFGPKLLETILGYCVDEDYYDLSDPAKGYDFRIIKVKRDGFPNYDSSKPSKNSSAIKEDVMKEMLEAAPDIHAMIDSKITGYDEIRTAFEIGGSTPSTPEDAESVDQDELLDRLNKKLNKSDE